MTLRTTGVKVDFHVQKAVRVYTRKAVLSFLIMAGALFGSAGRFDWIGAWILLAAHLITQVVSLKLLDPELLAERSKFQKGTKRWDVPIVLLAAGAMPIATLIVAGLDARYGWTPSFGTSTLLLAAAVFALGWMLILWAMQTNRFFSATVRIQHERSHQVISGGPYRYIRHPGYAGAILFQLAIPFLLSSFWALIPSGLSAVLFILRTALEDRTLQEELSGYADYAARVRSRLVPGLW
jgi:protein-S-isoprenylcysteine O-methyltransferase Ste14